MLKVVAIFDSLQGEGTFIGVPMTLIRLSGCNLRCDWCDTDYSWTEGKNMKEEDIAKDAHFLHCCITGGEPLIQNLKELVRQLNHDHIIHIETNGTIRPEPLDIDYWVISPKMKNSGMLDRLNLKTLVGLYDDITSWAEVEFKFVIEARADMFEAMDLIRKIDKRSQRGVNSPIIFQPQGSIAPKDTTHMTTDYCASIFKYFESIVMMTNTIKSWRDQFKGYDVRVLPQLHRILWGLKRGR